MKYLNKLKKKMRLFLGIISVICTLSVATVNLTPNPQDDSWLAILHKFLGIFVLHSTENSDPSMGDFLDVEEEPL